MFGKVFSILKTNNSELQGIYHSFEKRFVSDACYLKLYA